MGWGVQLDTVVYVPRVRKDEVKSKIEENEETIKDLEIRLCMMAASNPRDIASEESKEDGEIISEIQARITDILEEYRACIGENKLLYVISEELDKAEDC